MTKKDESQASQGSKEADIDRREIREMHDSRPIPSFISLVIRRAWGKKRRRGMNGGGRGEGHTGAEALFLARSACQR